MAGEEDSAVKALKIFLDPSNSGGLGSIEIYEVKLILVEMLIYQVLLSTHISLIFSLLLYIALPFSLDLALP